MKNVMIKGTGVYTPANKVYNEQLDEHFEKRGLSAHNLMNHLGRRKRFLLADEINRATPRTQSSLLECMADGQVTVPDGTYKLALEEKQ